MSNKGWAVHCIAEDCKTALSPFVDVESLDVLRRLLRCAGASDTEMTDFEAAVSRWSHASCWISDLTPDGARLLRIDVKAMLSMSLKTPHLSRYHFSLTPPRAAVRDCEPFCRW